MGFFVGGGMGNERINLNFIVVRFGRNSFLMCGLGEEGFGCWLGGFLRGFGMGKLGGGGRGNLFFCEMGG